MTIPKVELTPQTKPEAQEASPKTKKFAPKESNWWVKDDVELLRSNAKSELSFYGKVLSGENVSKSYQEHSKKRLENYKKYIEAHPVASYFNLSRLKAYVLERITK